MRVSAPAITKREAKVWRLQCQVYPSSRLAPCLAFFKASAARSTAFGEEVISLHLGAPKHGLLGVVGPGPLAGEVHQRRPHSGVHGDLTGVAGLGLPHGDEPGEDVHVSPPEPALLAPSEARMD